MLICICVSIYCVILAVLIRFGVASEYTLQTIEFVNYINSSEAHWYRIDVKIVKEGASYFRVRSIATSLLVA